MFDTHPVLEIATNFVHLVAVSNCIPTLCYLGATGSAGLV